MYSTSKYSEKFKRIAQQSPYQDLIPHQQELVRTQAFRHRFTLQELRQVSEMVLDLERWKEPLPIHLLEGTKSNKRVLLEQLRQRHTQLQSGLKDYDHFDQSDKPRSLKPRIEFRQKKRLGLGSCPVASPRTRCCNLLTLDAVERCGFDCSYCSIQSFYHGNKVWFDPEFGARLTALRLVPDRLYHIGTGQASDSLLWGNHNGVLAQLCDFARANPNVILELKTKSKNIEWLVKNKVPGNVICTWSLNSPTVIRHEEHMTAPLKSRLDAAQKMADQGRLVGFHFHPLVWYRDGLEEYEEICNHLLHRFDPKQVAMVSLGTLTFSRKVMKTIRQRQFRSKILQMPMTESAGKFSYPEEIKLEMFKRVYGTLTPWHDRVFFYLCMEPANLWTALFGYDYTSNEEFEQAMKERYMEKIRALSGA